MDEYALSGMKGEVKKWYDGFIFGSIKEIYNPWSIIHYLSERRVGTYWANTSSNSLIGKLIRQGGKQMKETFRQLLAGESIEAEIDEQIVYEQLDLDENAVWSLFLASGYLKVKNYRAEQFGYTEWKEVYELEITNFETMIMFRSMLPCWKPEVYQGNESGSMDLHFVERKW